MACGRDSRASARPVPARLRHDRQRGIVRSLNFRSGMQPSPALEFPLVDALWALVQADQFGLLDDMALHRAFQLGPARMGQGRAASHPVHTGGKNSGGGRLAGMARRSRCASSHLRLRAFRAATRPKARLAAGRKYSPGCCKASNAPRLSAVPPGRERPGRRRSAPGSWPRLERPTRTAAATGRGRRRCRRTGCPGRRQTQRSSGSGVRRCRPCAGITCATSPIASTEPRPR